MARSYATQSIIFVLIQGVFLGGIINNFAHIGGFAGGYAAARVLDPLKPERVDHIVIALVCLGVSLLAVIASVIFGLPLYLRLLSQELAAVFESAEPIEAESQS